MMIQKVAHLLDRKGREVWTVGPDETVLHALEVMAEKDGGAVVVVEKGKVVGMFSERHYARNVILKGRSSPKTAIRDVMRTRFAYVRPDQTVEDCMAVMAAEGVRYLPVMEGEKLVGLVSMGDLLRACIAERENDIKQLVSYISGTR
jgi:CBS domain-containing protein